MQKIKSAHEFYEKLLDPIDENTKVTFCVSSSHWCLVKTDSGLCGIAMSYPGGKREKWQNPVGMHLKELASWILSWDFQKASIGMAAINAFYNQPQKKTKISKPSLSIQSEIKEKWVGKKVACVGHFPFTQEIDNHCELTVLEREPKPGDYPDSACEFLLPLQDLVIITASTLINKTFFRLANLSQNAHSVLIGPSTPKTPLIHHAGITQISGISVLEAETMIPVIASGGSREIFATSLVQSFDLIKS